MRTEKGTWICSILYPMFKDDRIRRSFWAELPHNKRYNRKLFSPNVWGGVRFATATRKFVPKRGASWYTGHLAGRDYSFVDNVYTG